MSLEERLRQIVPTLPTVPTTAFITNTFTAAPTEVTNPLIPTEVFVELNPELESFYETQYLPENYSSYQGYKYQAWSCAPRRFCIPRPCTPV